MSHTLCEGLASAEVRPIAETASMSVFGLNCLARRAPNHRASRAVAEALGFEQLANEPDAPTLTAHNASGQPALLIAGEVIAAGPQAYVVNQSVMLPAGRSTLVPVSAISLARGHAVEGPIRLASCLVHGRLRERLHKDIHESYRLAAAPVPYRSNVRAEVDRMLRALGCRSPSASLCSAYKDFAEYVEEMLGGIPAPKDGCGVVVVSGSRLRGIELFDSPETLAHYWDSLLQSFGLDAILEDPPTDAPALDGVGVRRLLEALGNAEVSSYASPGLGDDVRIRTTGLLGAALLVDDAVVHAELFAAD